MTSTPLRHPIQLACGLMLLARLILRTRGHLNGPYWQWRRLTATGMTTLPRSQRLTGLLSYARWMAQMRHLR